MANKTCVKCQETKTLDQFYKAKYNYDKDGYDYYCKYCRNGSHLASIRNNSKKCSLDNCDKSHYAKDLCRTHYARQSRHGGTNSKIKPVPSTRTYTNKYGETLYSRNKTLMKKYKITLDQYLERTANGCELCGEYSEINYNVDHNHKCCTGQTTCGNCVRGIVCHRCNVAIDKMEDGIMRPDYPNYWLIKQYLEAYSG